MIRPMASSYTGVARILDTNGSLLTVGTVNIEKDEETNSWNGTLEVIGGTGVAGKALVVDLEMNGSRGRAQLIPLDDQGDIAHSRVVGLGPSPF